MGLPTSPKTTGDKKWTWGLAITRRDWGSKEMVQLVYPVSIKNQIDIGDYGPNIWLSRCESTVDDERMTQEDSVSRVIIADNWTRKNTAATSVPSPLVEYSDKAIEEEAIKRKETVALNIPESDPGLPSPAGPTLKTIELKAPELDGGAKVELKG